MPAPTERSSGDDDDIRHTLLADASREAGTTWAQWWFDDLRRQGRAVTGGWPGTMSEARGHARARVDAILASRSMSAVTHDELKTAARLTYDSAKALWQRFQVRRKPTRRKDAS